MFTIDEIIDLAVQIEQNGERILSAAHSAVSHPELLSLLKWMENEERQHIKWFTDLKTTARDASEMDHLEEMGKNLLRQMVGDQGFSLQDADFSKIETIQEMIATLIEFEKDTALFYQMIRSAVTDPETLSLLDRIIMEENRHAERLAAYLDSDWLSF